MPAVAELWVEWLSVCVRTLKQKRLELSTPNLANIQCMAVARLALSQKGQRSRSHVGSTAGQCDYHPSSVPSHMVLLSASINEDDHDDDDKSLLVASQPLPVTAPPLTRDVTSSRDEDVGCCCCCCCWWCVDESSDEEREWQLASVATSATLTSTTHSTSLSLSHLHWHLLGLVPNPNHKSAEN